MMACNSSTTTTAAATTDYYGATAVTSIHPDIIQTHILTRLDGPTLASTSCAASQLHSLCTEENLWKNICTSHWPSTNDPRVQDAISTFRSGHRSFFYDSYPTVHQQYHRRPKCKDRQQGSVPTSELISAIDIRYGDELVYSKVVVTETLTGWFVCSPLRLDLVEPKEIVPTPVKYDGEAGKCIADMEENMRLSWILIDPTRKRAMNLSSLRPVEVRQHWLTGDIQVRFATVVDAAGAKVDGEFAKCSVMVTCGGKVGGDLHVREISMQVEDMEGKILSGKDSLVILQAAMEGKRRKGQIGEEKKRYENFLEMRRVLRERRQSRERRLDLACIATGVTLFMSFWMFVLFR